MPIPDPEERRKYQQTWYQHKRDGFPTRTTPKLTAEESKEARKESQRTHYKRRTTLIVEIFGDSCYICGNKTTRCIHRKDGKRHKLFSSMSLSEIRGMNWDERYKYIRLCSWCHKSVHWSMIYLDMTWAEIENIVQGRLIG